MGSGAREESFIDGILALTAGRCGDLYAFLAGVPLEGELL